jgi:hypothetical protein
MITNKEVIISVSKKLMYVVVVVAMLAMMIPMAIPVNAAGGTITMNIIDPITGLVSPDGGYNVTGSIVEVTATPATGTVIGWNVINISTAPGSGAAQIVGTPTTGVTGVARVQGIWGEANIQALISDNTTLTIDKKWGQIDHTDISAPGYSAVTWNEAGKAWEGSATVSDSVTGVFYAKDPVNPPDPSHLTYHAVQGVILNWYLVAGNVSVPMASGDASVLKPAMAAFALLHQPTHVTFSNGLLTYRSVTPASGINSIGLLATGEEAVQVVVVPEYPGTVAQIPVTPEVTSYDFYTTEMDVVPQVRWAGEKIVLEKNFGTTYNGLWVKFSLQNQSVGSLEAIQGFTNYTNGNAVWTVVVNGFASCILVSSDEGVANVTAGLYDAVGPDFTGAELINQHFFTVYYLKLESLTLGDVNGKRAQHNAGLWVPGDPWDTSTDNVTQTLNVSQDALLRAQVKGWFTSNNPSTRPVRTIDPTNSTLNNPETATLTLPAGRWILPDDWATLAGPNWKQSRLHWDIMCNPDGSVGALSPTASTLVANSVYKMPPLTGTVVSGNDVIGPFSPGLELMTPLGWTIPNGVTDPLRDISTVVPDGKLNKWDAPMPAAKIIFQIQAAGVTPNINTAGYFKSAMKSDIYYTMVGQTLVYVNPFYQSLIPAHEAIPAFINNGGYDWDSFDSSYGPYTFWQMINQHAVTPLVATSDPSGHPTVAEVYSDNHGEAMIWLNGNWNLYLQQFFYKAGSVDVPFGATVATTTIQATADYPYSRLHQAIQSNMDTKTWLWGGMILGTDGHLYPGNVSTSNIDTQLILSIGTWDPATVNGTGDHTSANSLNKMVWVWVTDRDGSRAGVNGAMVSWTVAAGNGTAGGYIPNLTGAGISNFNAITQNINLQGGFLDNTNGMITDGANRMHGISYLRAPTSWETSLFLKFWGPTGTSGITADPAGYVVAAIDVQSLGGYTSRVNVSAEISSHDFDLVMGQAVAGTLIYNTNLDFSIANALDDAPRMGDANNDGNVNMADVTTVERMILGMVGVAQNAVIDGSCDMGTVVKIERKILGYK